MIFILKYSKSNIYKLSINDILQLSKIRLTMSVVFSAIAGYFIAGGIFQSFDLIALFLGGFLVVASSNGFNQVIEKDLDKLMKRTEDRPLPKQRMTTNQALILSLAMGLVGVFFLFSINFYSGFLDRFRTFVCFSLYTFKANFIFFSFCRSFSWCYSFYVRLGRSH